MHHPELHFILIDQDPKKIICEVEEMASALLYTYHLQYQILNFRNNTTFKITS